MGQVRIVTILDGFSFANAKKIMIISCHRPSRTVEFLEYYETYILCLLCRKDKLALYIIANVT